MLKSFQEWKEKQEIEYEKVDAKNHMLNSEGQRKIEKTQEQDVVGRLKTKEECWLERLLRPW